MSDDKTFDYDRMVEDAMRGLVREILRRTASAGLSGEHHFYISFRTDAAGVGMPSRLRAQYPHEITVVLQHQFWNLEIGEDGFSVELAFAGKRERLDVPYAALTGFADPSAQFGLKFGQDKAVAANSGAKPAAPGGKTAPATAASAGKSAEKPAEKPAETPGEKVISLDQFRKK